MHQSPKPTKSLAIHNTMNITLSHKLSTDSPILNNPLYNTPHRLPSLPITITISTTPSTALPFPLSLGTPRITNGVRAPATNHTSSPGFVVAGPNPK